MGANSFFKLLRPVRYPAGLAGVRFLGALARMLPRPALLRYGACWGGVAYALAKTERKRARAHLDAAFPRKTAAERRRLARACFEHLGMCAMEVLRLRSMRPEELLSLILNPELYDQAERELATGENAVFVIGHLGNWEYFGAASAARGFPVHTIAKRLRDPAYDRFICDIRARFGVDVIYSDTSPRVLLKLIKSGEPVAILADQDIPAIDGVFVDFFGRPAYTPVAPAALARTANVPVYVCALLREGPRFRLMRLGPYEPARTRDKQADLADLTQRWCRGMEELIVRYPEQWVWMHRRWRTTPASLARRREREREEA